MPAVVIYDDDCGLCRRLRRLGGRLDTFGALRWLPLQHEEALRYGIPRAELERRMYLVSGARRWGGFAAVKRILLRLPPFWALAGMAAAIEPWSVAGFLLLFSPLLSAPGERVYDLVARNRPAGCRII